jgi:hypothetical protein
MKKQGGLQLAQFSQQLLAGVLVIVLFLYALPIPQPLLTPEVFGHHHSHDFLEIIEDHMPEGEQQSGHQHIGAAEHNPLFTPHPQSNPSPSLKRIGWQLASHPEMIQKLAYELYRPPRSLT